MVWWLIEIYPGVENHSAKAPQLRCTQQQVTKGGKRSGVTGKGYCRGRRPRGEKEGNGDRKGGEYVLGNQDLYFQIGSVD